MAKKSIGELESIIEQLKKDKEALEKEVYKHKERTLFLSKHLKSVCAQNRKLLTKFKDFFNASISEIEKFDLDVLSENIDYE